MSHNITTLLNKLPNELIEHVEYHLYGKNAKEGFDKVLTELKFFFPIPYCSANIKITMQDQIRVHGFMMRQPNRWTTTLNYKETSV